MLVTLRQRDFSLLWFAGFISLMGNWMLSIALKVVIYDMTGSALAVGGSLLATALPGILFSSVAGVCVDRWERRRTLVLVNLLLAIAILPMLLVRSSELLWLVYVILFVQATLTQFFGPAESAMLPLLSDPKYLPTANALNALNNNLARLVGPAVGGLLVVWVGLSGVVIVDVVTYLVAALLAGLISVTSHPGEGNVAISLRRVAHEWLDGLRLIWRVDTVRTLLLLYILPCISESIMAVLFVPFVLDVLHGDALNVGTLVSAQAVGGLAGSVLIGAVAARIRPSKLVALGGIGIGLADFVLFNYFPFVQIIAVAYAMFVLAGPFAVALSAGFQTLIQTSVPDAYRGRVFSTLNLTQSLFSLVGIAIAGTASETWQIVPTINLQAYAYFLLGIGCLVLLRERAMDTPAVEQVTSA